MLPELSRYKAPISETGIGLFFFGASAASRFLDPNILASMVGHNGRAGIEHLATATGVTLIVSGLAGVLDLDGNKFRDLAVKTYPFVYMTTSILWEASYVQEKQNGYIQYEQLLCDLAGVAIGFFVSKYFYQMSSRKNINRR